MRDILIKESLYGIKKIQKYFFGKELNMNVENSKETYQFMMHDNLDKAEITWDRIYNSLSIMLLILDKKGKAINCNSAFRKYIKKPKNEITGKYLLEIIYGKNIDLHDNLINALEITKKKQSKEIKVNTKWLKISVDPVLNGRKNIKNMIVVITDITERKNNLKELELRESKYKNLVELSNVAIATDDTNGNLIYFNNQFAELFGYSEAELENITHKELVHPDDIEMVNSIHYNRITGIRQPSRYEHRGIKKNGDTIYIDISVTDIIDENGFVIGTRSYLRDVTERKNFINDLEIALEKAKESDRLKSAFLANISHEVRTPINGITGFVKLLERKDLTQNEINNYLEIISSCSNQLLTIVNDILVFSKIETGQIELCKESFNLNNFIQLIYKRFQPEFNLKELDYVLAINPSVLNVVVNTDKGKIDQIISNLLNNAIKFTEMGKVELSCELKSNYIEISVKDTGIGIEKELHKKIFDRFRQVELEIAKKYDGNGLGLSICRGLVELLEGKIWVDSEKEKGSTFYFTIPFN